MATKKALNDHTTEELKDQAMEDLRTCATHLLRAGLAVNSAIGIMLLVRAEYSAAAGSSLDEAAGHFRTVSERLTRATSAWEVVIQRARKK